MKLTNNLILLGCMLTVTFCLKILTAGLMPQQVQAATQPLKGFDRVLDSPMLCSRVMHQGRDGREWLVFELDWPSRWRGGPVELRGTLFIQHRHQPAGRVLACRLDPSQLAQDSRFIARLPLVPGDGSSRVLAECDLDELLVHFTSRN